MADCGNSWLSLCLKCCLEKKKLGKSLVEQNKSSTFAPHLENAVSCLPTLEVWVRG